MLSRSLRHVIGISNIPMAFGIADEKMLNTGHLNLKNYD